MMEAEKLKSQASSSTQAPTENNSSKPQPSSHSLTDLSRRLNQNPLPPSPFNPPPSRHHQTTSRSQVVKLMSTVKMIVQIAKFDKSQGEKAIEFCELLGINI
ncbi:hypothetical protein TNCT_687851 [Trichonephila clavata]|uniref:Uncharacterized protein n=1 Tax=Trichonephila clavata TaxID=2740835 RepID=A0A8X6HZZ7_TRICU|nr:hypothetical protein TNCT_687851 [Trichonephila clavata]